MSTITANEWASLPVEHRITMAKNMTMTHQIELFKGIKPTPDRGPRISKDEWIALGNEGQEKLQPFLTGWETRILYAWIEQAAEEKQQKDKNETVEGAKVAISGLAILLLAIIDAGILIFGVVAFGIVGLIVALLLVMILNGGILGLIGLLNILR